MYKLTRKDRELVVEMARENSNQINKKVEKNFNIKYNVGKAKYLVSFHNGIKTYPDGSAFYDIRIFKNKKKLKTFTDDLKKDGYIEI